MDKIDLQPNELWQIIVGEVKIISEQEPALTDFLHQSVLNHAHFDTMLSCYLSKKLAHPFMNEHVLLNVFLDAMDADASITVSAQADIIAYYQRDPACDAYFLPLLYYKGFHALQVHRINHWLWKNQRKSLAFFLQSRSSEIFGVDIHPAAQIGNGLMIDHGTGVVIGETAVLGDNISLLQGVTLGGSGKETGDRHPKIGNGVLIGAHASILGNITIGECAKIGAGSVVLNDIPEFMTAVGVPARLVGERKTQRPAEDMDQWV